MVLGQVGGQLVHIAPVGGLLVRDNDVGDQNLQRAHVRRKRRAGGVRTQQKDSLNARLKAGHIELTKRVDWLIKYAVDQVDCSFLSIRGVISEYRKYRVCSITDSILIYLYAVPCKYDHLLLATTVM